MEQEESIKTGSALMKWMRKHNVDIDSADDDGVAPFYSAVDNTLPKATKELYAAGSNVKNFSRIEGH